MTTLPHGYKSSSLGPTPQDWEVLEFGQFAEQKKSKYTPNINETRKCLELEHIDQVTGNILGRTNSNEQKSTKNTFSKGEVLFGKLRPYLRKFRLAEFDGVCSSEIRVLKSKNTKCSNEFIYNLVQTNGFIQVANVSSGSKMPRADWDYVSSFPFPLPPLPEQTAIASILSNCDNAITTTQSLIDRLQRRHKALCQQLLTGKKRLQGFSEPFKKLQADEIFKNVSIKNMPQERLLSATQDQGIIPRDMLEARVTMPTTQAVSYKLVEPGNFVISLRSFQGGLEYSTYRGIVSPAYTVLKAILPINDDFYKYYFKSYNFIGHLAVAVIGIRDGKQISFDNFCALSIHYPSPEEQTAIASILNVSQAQIELAQMKLSKLKQHKQGLMQQLLTGKTRVPSEYL